MNSRLSVRFLLWCKCRRAKAGAAQPGEQNPLPGAAEAGAAQEQDGAQRYPGLLRKMLSWCLGNQHPGAPSTVNSSAGRGAEHLPVGTGCLGVQSLVLGGGRGPLGMQPRFPTGRRADISVCIGEKRPS